MSSVKDEITGQTIANEIMMERSAHHGSLFLVEGETDASLFKGFADLHECSIIVCAGWENLFDAINVLSDMSIEDALGFSDRDYFGDTGFPEYNGVIIFTDENDLEIQMVCSQALNKLLEEFGIADRVKAEVSASGMMPSELGV